MAWGAASAQTPGFVVRDMRVEGLQRIAEGTVYKAYDIPVRVFGWSVEIDQQLAGAIMKTAGGIFL